VARYIDEPQHATIRQRCVSVAQIQRNPARLLLGQSIRIHAGERFHQSGFTMVDMTCCADDHAAHAQLRCIALQSRELREELVGVFQAAQIEPQRAFRHAAPRNLLVLRVNCGRNLGRGHVERPRFVRIDQDQDLALASTNNLNVADTIDRFDLFLDLFIGNVGNFADVRRRREPRQLLVLGKR